MAPPPTPSESVRNRFLADHGRIEDVLERLINAFGANDHEEIQRLWTDFESSLLLHIEAEEKFLIPTLLHSREREAHRLLEEHKHIRTQLAELGAGIDLHLVRLETARALADELRAHARDEDGIYQWADTALVKSEQTSLLSAIARTVRTIAHSGPR